MAKMKRTRTNYAPEFETMEAMDAAVTLDEAMTAFLLSKKAERASERTLKDYQSHFRYFKAWVDGRYKELPVSKITTKILHEYVSYMSNEKVQFDDHPTKKRSKKGVRGLSPMTVNVRIRTLRAFLNWAFANGYIRVNIAQNLKLQKVDEDKIMAFTQEQVKKLLMMPDRSTFSGFRDYVLMLMLLDTGLRINELLSIEVSDVDFETLMFTVPWEKAKTRKMRQVPISKKVAKLLAELIQENKDFDPNPTKLFYSAYGNELSVNSVDERLSEYGKQAGITDVRCSSHTFRHTFAVHWIKAGGDPFSLQKILGHTDMSMVRRYVRLSVGDVKAKHNQFSPVHLFAR